MQTPHPKTNSMRLNQYEITLLYHLKAM